MLKVPYAILPLVDFRPTPGRLGDLDFSGPDGKSLARQEFAEECDINTIMARYEAGGAVSHVNRAEPRYMDFSEVPDLREALDFVRDAGFAFNSLPAKVRKEFDNDPVLYVDFAMNPENIGQMREWGLAPPAPAEKPVVKVEVVPPKEPPKAP